MTDNPLHKQLQGVKPDPPAGTEDDITNDDVIEDDPNPAEGDGDDKDSKKEDDRPEKIILTRTSLILLGLSIAYILTVFFTGIKII